MCNSRNSYPGILFNSREVWADSEHLQDEVLAVGHEVQDSRNVANDN